MHIHTQMCNKKPISEISFQYQKIKNQMKCLCLINISKRANYGFWFYFKHNSLNKLF